MERRPLFFVTREKECELINRLITIIDNTEFNPNDTAIIMASPDYSATLAMHLSHAWSVKGEIIPIIPVDVAYPDEAIDQYVAKFKHDFLWHQNKYTRLVLVEAGIIRGGNWKWLVDELINTFNYSRENITLVAMCENINSSFKSDYVGTYFNDDHNELMFYYEKYNKHWPIR
mgnify:FL=1|jgi:hypothetical protein